MKPHTLIGRILDYRVALVNLRNTMSCLASSTRIAVCQMTTTEDKQHNLSQASSLISEAVDNGAKMCFLPEGFDSISPSRQVAIESGETIGGPLITYYRRLARDNQIWLSLGGFKEKSVKDETKTRNTHVLIDNDGEIVSKYSKLHLFNVHIPGKVQLSESSYTEPGERITPVVNTPVGRLALGICYDLRFPEMSCAQTQLGAEILTYPSAFTVPTGKAHWTTLLRARAVETQCYVIAAAQVGEHNSKRSSYGHSCIIDPWGEVLCDIEDGVGVAYADISRSEVEKRRQHMPISQHRLPNVYAEANMLANEEDVESIDELKSYKFAHIDIYSRCVFYRSKLSYAFVNKKPVLPGHMLVSPHRIVPRFLDLTVEEMNDLWHTVRLVSQAVESHFSAESLTINVQDGPAAGQSIPHVHVHVLPRKPGDFKDVDDIYSRLEKHDKDDRGKPLPSSDPRWREEDVMIEEATAMRAVMSKVLCDRHS